MNGLKRKLIHRGTLQLPQWDNEVFGFVQEVARVEGGREEVGGWVESGCTVRNLQRINKSLKVKQTNKQKLSFKFTLSIQLVAQHSSILHSNGLFSQDVKFYFIKISYLFPAIIFKSNSWYSNLIWKITFAALSESDHSVWLVWAWRALSKHIK